MCRCPVASPRALHCALGQKEISSGVAMDSQELCATERVFMSVPTERVAEEGMCLRHFQKGAAGV